MLQQLRCLEMSEKILRGQQLNAVKCSISEAISARRACLEDIALQRKLTEEAIDVTLPGRQPTVGSLHPVTAVTKIVERIFLSLGFSLVEGPEIESSYYNFEALNMPAEHPARAEVDTFYLRDSTHLLRTHTSCVQIHVLENAQLPLRILTPGKVYRRDSDQTHTPMFHQLEGLVVDKESTFSDLKAILQYFFEAFFGKSVSLRFRPSYFPFTEPSAEVDIAHDLCKGEGCTVCGNTGWLEVLGCGMVHPSILSRQGIDSTQYRGLAFGLGLDRLAMLRYGIEDLRLLFKNDLRLLEQL
eukprot:TRINITY_DN5669_c0_g1_i5.p3 TRINITY_DN5669_c0_g1~~TRINITY_DN5669_c0_g1_i5.p3  ORF type:complete len:299 (+),score=-62.81 TRINITY_DN5669_c0_g1_i5:3229-4125(+)